MITCYDQQPWSCGPNQTPNLHLTACQNILQVRPRGWHLWEKHVLVDGRPVPGGIFDFALFFFHCARPLLDRGSGAHSASVPLSTARAPCSDAHSDFQLHGWSQAGCEGGHCRWLAPLPPAVLDLWTWWRGSQGRVHSA